MIVNINQTRFEANSDLYGARKQFQNAAIQYYIELNSMEYMKQCILLQSMLSFMHSQVRTVQYIEWIILFVFAYNSWLTLKWDMMFWPMKLGNFLLMLI